MRVLQNAGVDFYYWRFFTGLFCCGRVVGILPFEQPQPPPERPDFRRVTEHGRFKKLPHEMRALIEKELLLYDDALRCAQRELQAHGQKLKIVQEGLAELSSQLR